MIGPHVQANGLEKFQGERDKHRDNCSLGASRMRMRMRGLYHRADQDRCVKERFNRFRNVIGVW